MEAEKIPPIVISFKQNEKWISDYAREHNSPAAWIKDLITQEYKVKNVESHACKTARSLFDD